MGSVDGTGSAERSLKELGSRPLTQPVKKSKGKPLRSLVPSQSLRPKEDVTMEDRNPPGHLSPP